MLLQIRQTKIFRKRAQIRYYLPDFCTPIFGKTHDLSVFLPTFSQQFFSNFFFCSKPNFSFYPHFLEKLFQKKIRRINNTFRCNGSLYDSASKKSAFVPKTDKKALFVEKRVYLAIWVSYDNWSLRKFQGNFYKILRFLKKVDKSEKFFFKKIRLDFCLEDSRVTNLQIQEPSTVVAPNKVPYIFRFIFGYFLLELDYSPISK